MADVAASHDQGIQRATYSARFVARDSDWNTFTVLEKDLLVTTWHSFPEAVVGQGLELYVNDPSAPQQRRVDAEVFKILPLSDLLYVKLKGGAEVEAPPKDHFVGCGSEYLLLAASSPSHPSRYSISHGRISSTDIDRDANIRGDTPSNPGDSGGGCFSVETGKLVAINLGRVEAEGKAVLKPVSTVMGLLYGV
ncbi:hypothetical protein HXX76_009499 [Chlamydomonas incerta]|uniref:Serine protease n=1 Tax=Chlamydomonas incerta TaxID=51695 RepID=A0A835VXF6_CHLIN|nr:hypothetical protein HXX76_009499 [Chlamydomonas incerta]|eukprot:KAG2431485.1 hypothetical protein HXX76_009499 [Chlamydomonas incerta]